MLPELENRIEKLCVYFRDYESTVLTLASQLAALQAPTGRQTGMARARAAYAIQELLKTSQSSLAPILKLGYVRAARQTTPKYTLDDWDQALLLILNHNGNRLLRLSAQCGINRVQRVSQRSLIAANVRDDDNPNFQLLRTIPNTLLRPWGLEQYARGVLRNVTEQALQLGTVAPTTPHDKLSS